MRRACRSTETSRRALRDEDFGQHEAILLGFPRNYGAVGEGSKPVAPVAPAIQNWYRGFLFFREEMCSVGSHCGIDVLELFCLIPRLSIPLRDCDSCAPCSANMPLFRHDIGRSRKPELPICDRFFARISF